MTMDKSWKKDQWADLSSDAFAEGWIQMLDSLDKYFKGNIVNTLSIPGLLAKNKKNAEQLIANCEGKNLVSLETLDMMKHIAYQCHANPLKEIKEKWQQEIPMLRNRNAEQIGEASYVVGLNQALNNKNLHSRT